MKTAQISLETARELYKQGGAAAKLALDNFTKEELEKKKLPTKWEEVEPFVGYYIGLSDKAQRMLLPVKPNIIGNQFYFTSEEMAEGFVTLSQLIILRDIYNDGWKADWKNYNVTKYNISGYKGNIERSYYHQMNKVLSFKTPELRDEFFSNFEAQIQQVVDLGLI